MQIANFPMSQHWLGMTPSTKTSNSRIVMPRPNTQDYSVRCRNFGEEGNPREVYAISTQLNCMYYVPNVDMH